MIPLLGPSDPFPPVERALHEPNGLLAAGGGLSVARLVDAYQRGIFPWFSEGDPVLWWSPDPRMVLRTDRVHVSRSLRRRLRRGDYEVSFNRAFGDVLQACAAPRRAPGAAAATLAVRVLPAVAPETPHGPTLPRQRRSSTVAERRFPA